MCKLSWMFLALIAPEALVYMAWRQWSSAKALSAEVNNILDAESGEGKASALIIDN
jgi:hypothetical protein